jgi:hypothetical protein
MVPFYVVCFLFQYRRKLRLFLTTPPLGQCTTYQNDGMILNRIRVSTFVEENFGALVRATALAIEMSWQYIPEYAQVPLVTPFRE